MARQPDVRYIRMYTDGNAARKLEAAPFVKRAKIPRTKKRKVIVLHVDPVAILGIITAVAMMLVMITSLSRYQKVQAQTSVIEEYVDQLRLENKALHAKYESGYDIAQVERTALALGMVPSSEVTHARVEVPEPQVEHIDRWASVRAFFLSLFA